MSGVVARLQRDRPSQGQHRRVGLVVAQVSQPEVVIAHRAVGIDRQDAIGAQRQLDGLAQLERTFDRELLTIVPRLRVGWVERQAAIVRAQRFSVAFLRLVGASQGEKPVR